MQWTATSAAAQEIREVLWEHRKVDMLSGCMVEIRLGRIEGTIAKYIHICLRAPAR